MNKVIIKNISAVPLRKIVATIVPVLQRVMHELGKEPHLSGVVGYTDMFEQGICVKSVRNRQSITLTAFDRKFGV